MKIVDIRGNMDEQEWQEGLCRHPHSGGCSASPITSWQTWATKMEKDWLHASGALHANHKHTIPAYTTTSIPPVEPHDLPSRDVLAHSCSKPIAFVTSSEFFPITPQHTTMFCSVCNCLPCQCCVLFGSDSSECGDCSHTLEQRSHDLSTQGRSSQIANRHHFDDSEFFDDFEQESCHSEATCCNDYPVAPGSLSPCSSAAPGSLSTPVAPGSLSSASRVDPGSLSSVSAGERDGSCSTQATNTSTSTSPHRSCSTQDACTSRTSTSTSTQLVVNNFVCEYSTIVLICRQALTYGMSVTPMPYAHAGKPFARAKRPNRL